VGEGSKRDYSGFTERVSRFESAFYIMGIERSEVSASVLGSCLYGKEEQLSPLKLLTQIS